MNIEKIRLDELYRCYSTMAMELDGELHYFFASEEKGYPCYTYPAKDPQARKTVWEKGGGTMSMIPIPDRPNEFLAIMDFYLKETPSLSRLDRVVYRDGEFLSQTLLKLPFMHRFDVFKIEDELWFVGATIAHDKKDKEDWSQAGKIYRAKLPEDLNRVQDIQLEVIAEGLFRNHGYTRGSDGKSGYFGSDEGITKVTLPDHKGGEWSVERILNGTIGEIALCDVNHDDIEEIMTIEPFHGTAIKVYEKNQDGYSPVYEYPYEIDFAHTLVGARINGVNSFIGGIRRINPDLFIVQYQDNVYTTTVVDKGAGPANLNVLDVDGLTVIHSANHTNNEAALYLIRAEGA